MSMIIFFLSHFMEDVPQISVKYKEIKTVDIHKNVHTIFSTVYKTIPLHYGALRNLISKKYIQNSKVNQRLTYSLALVLQSQHW